MTWTMISWSKEEVGENRVKRIQSLQQKLVRNRTPQEKRFIKFMSAFGKPNVLWFTQQKVVHMNSEKAFILDFYCKQFNTVIEIDGDHHSNNREKKEYDEWRTRLLSARDMKVLRFRNFQVDDSVYEVLHTVISTFVESGGQPAKRLRQHLCGVSKKHPQLYYKVFPNAHRRPSQPHHEDPTNQLSSEFIQMVRSWT